MKLSEARRIQADAAYHGTICYNKDFIRASQIAVEAIKQIQWLRESQVFYDGDLLPGETKD